MYNPIVKLYALVDFHAAERAAVVAEAKYQTSCAEEPFEEHEELFDAMNLAWTAYHQAEVRYLHEAYDEPFLLIEY